MKNETNSSGQGTCLKKELRGRKLKISRSIDADERFRQKRMRCVKYCIHEKHNIPLDSITTNWTLKHISVSGHIVVKTCQSGNLTYIKYQDIEAEVEGQMGKMAIKKLVAYWQLKQNQLNCRLHVRFLTFNTFTSTHWVSDSSAQTVAGPEPRPLAKCWSSMNSQSTVHALRSAQLPSCDLAGLRDELICSRHLSLPGTLGLRRCRLARVGFCTRCFAPQRLLRRSPPLLSLGNIGLHEVEEPKVPPRPAISTFRGVPHVDLSACAVSVASSVSRRWVGSVRARPPPILR